MKKILRFFLLAAVLGLCSCLMPGKVTIDFYNNSSSPVAFTMNGSPLPANPVASGHWTGWAALSPGSFTLTAAVTDSSGQSPVSTTVNLSGSQLYTWTVSNGLTQSGTTSSY
jgi:hypothetical protein